MVCLKPARQGGPLTLFVLQPRFGDKRLKLLGSKSPKRDCTVLKTSRSGAVKMGNSVRESLLVHGNNLEHTNSNNKNKGSGKRLRGKAGVTLTIISLKKNVPP